MIKTHLRVCLWPGCIRMSLTSDDYYFCVEEHWEEWTDIISDAIMYAGDNDPSNEHIRLDLINTFVTLKRNDMGDLAACMVQFQLPAFRVRELLGLMNSFINATSDTKAEMWVSGPKSHREQTERVVDALARQSPNIIVLKEDS